LLSGINTPYQRKEKRVGRPQNIPPGNNNYIEIDFFDFN
jgi:hypothetical protein